MLCAAAVKSCPACLIADQFYSVPKAEKLRCLALDINEEWFIGTLVGSNLRRI